MTIGPEIELPGRGAVKRPPQAKDVIATPPPAYDWTQAPTDDGTPTAGEFGIPDKDQGTSSSCTCQSTGYGMYGATNIDISREDPYSNVRLPGGGAYLNAPLDWFVQQGYVLLSEYPDPSPETETNMSKVIAVKDGDRIRTFTLNYSYAPIISVDAVAQMIAQHTFVIIGIEQSFTYGWNGSWTDPSYEGVDDDQHALFAGAAVIRKGQHAIKCKSSWTNHHDYLGQQSFVHYINEDYFNNGGVFEAIGVDVKETREMQPIFQHSGDATLYFAVGDVLVPFTSDFPTFQVDFASNPIIVLPDTEFAKFKIAQAVVASKK